MEGLIKEGGEAAEEDYQGEAKDALLSGAAQRVGHYEIAGYGTARAIAEKLGDHQAVTFARRDSAGGKRYRQDVDSVS